MLANTWSAKGIENDWRKIITFVSYNKMIVPEGS